MVPQRLSKSELSEASLSSKACDNLCNFYEHKVMEYYNLYFREETGLLIPAESTSDAKTKKIFWVSSLHTIFYQLKLR